MIQQKQHSLLNRANEAKNLLEEHINKGHVIRIISHNDADGLSAAGLIAKAIVEEGGQFHTTIVPRLKPEIISELKNERHDLFIFADMGSACIKPISYLKADTIIADHHQPTNINEEEQVKSTSSEYNMVHVNPHLFDIDGSTEISGAGTSYLTVRELGSGKKHLAPLALVGAFGDMQGQSGFIGINELIVEDGKESGILEIHEDLKITSKTQEPLYKSLAYTFTPSLPGLTGDLEESIGFLEKIGLSYGIKFSDLEDEEKDVLKDELVKINPKIFGDVYSVPKNNPILRDLEEYAYILDACGKNKKTGLGLSITLGEGEDALDAAINLQRKYREQLIKGMEWIKREGSQELNFIQYIYSEDKVLKSVMGTISAVGISVNLLTETKPILALARMHNDIKVSGRTTRKMVEKGVDLGKALHDSSLSVGGQGGGHDIAAGAMIPFKEMNNFINLVNDMIEYQLNN